MFDEDRVALNAMKFSSPKSAGASCMVMDGNGAGPTTTHAVDHSMDQVPLAKPEGGLTPLATSRRLSPCGACHGQPTESFGSAHLVGSPAAAADARTGHSGLEVERRHGCCTQVCVPLPAWAMRAGARDTIYYNPAEVNVAIVTCGGLCPGLNDVVLGLVNKLSDYGVPEGHILGIRCALAQPGWVSWVSWKDLTSRWLQWQVAR